MSNTKAPHLPREKSCGALVYRKDDRGIQILILKHRLGNHWSFPKGHVEGNETEVETALREVQEETGLQISLVEHFRQVVSYNPRPGVEKDVVYFLGYAQDSRTTRQEEEISEIRWVDLQDSQRFLTHKNDKRIVEKAKQHLRSLGIL